MLAVQIAKHLGAGRVVAVGRNESSLEKCRSLGADRIISLRNNLQDVSAAFSNEMSGYPIDVVLDFVWGQPAELLLKTLTGHDLRAVPTARAKYIQIGEMAGAHIQLAAETLRSRAIQLSGSGGGSVHLEYLQKIPEYYQEVLGWAAKGILSIETERVPLRDIEAAWNRTVHGKRLVVTNEP